MIPRPLKAGATDVMRQSVNSSAEFAISDVTPHLCREHRTNCRCSEPTGLQMKVHDAHMTKLFY